MSGAKTTTTTKTLRVTSLEPRGGQQLTSLEEAVVRMHHGVSLKPEAELATNGVNDQVMQQLLEMELKAFTDSGRIDDLDDIPEGASGSNEKTARIVADLKSKL
jgi:hypothetical protein